MTQSVKQRKAIAAAARNVAASDSTKTGKEHGKAVRKQVESMFDSTTNTVGEAVDYVSGLFTGLFSTKR